MGRRLTKYEQRQVASLIEDGGYSYRHAREMVLAGFGEPQPDTDEDRELAEGEARAQAREEREGDENAECAWESPE
jgi:hypothetical protein